MLKFKQKLYMYERAVENLVELSFIMVKLNQA